MNRIYCSKVVPALASLSFFSTLLFFRFFNCQSSFCCFYCRNSSLDILALPVVIWTNEIIQGVFITQMKKTKIRRRWYIKMNEPFSSCSLFICYHHHHYYYTIMLLSPQPSSLFYSITTSYRWYYIIISSSSSFSWCFPWFLCLKDDAHKISASIWLLQHTFRLHSFSTGTTTFISDESISGEKSCEIIFLRK